MRHLGQLSIFNTFCKCQMTTPDTPHQCVESVTGNGVKIRRVLVLFWALGIVVLVAGVIAAVR